MHPQEINKRQQFRILLPAKYGRELDAQWRSCQNYMARWSSFFINIVSFPVSTREIFVTFKRYPGKMRLDPYLYGPLDCYPPSGDLQTIRDYQFWEFYLDIFFICFVY